ncbi:LptA, protein essential for LPS transport across the periplasm [hydrothermal vent metagenome]|uniref:LptA, protein essential for LPS transport across the periplasm n=1 Tax=hydrothermal vent metagenome TaxID=652676 RepID=A0A1W1DTP2_9ZZZZ
MNRIIFILLLLPFTADALLNGRIPTDVKAYAVVIDERLGLSTYTGNAQIVQGSLIISAESIQIFSKNQEITKVIAVGTKKKPAHYKQNQPKQPRFIEATAQNITYFVGKQLVKLKGRAHLIQGFDSFSGGTLNYDIKKDKIFAKKSKDGTQRVQFKIKL